jgi:hypothetical protein
VSDQQAAEVERPTEPEPERCLSCRFAKFVIMDFAPDGEDTPTPVFECHRYPAVMVPVPNAEPTEGGFPMVAAWPQVDGEAWCGEYQPQEPRDISLLGF